MFHFELSWIPGGFLGVDVFFVISGYLITSQLWARSFHGRVAFGRFWVARGRRLLPALAATLLATTLASLLLDRDHLRSYLGDLGAAATYTSNWWYILHQRSYFESTGRPPVLQHLWSLAVEEQFYLLWPIVVAMVVGTAGSVMVRRRRLGLTCVLLAVASALVMGVGTMVSGAPLLADPSRYYFGTDAHASGLLIGAALAVWRGGRGFTRAMPALRPAGPAWTAAGVAALVAVLWTCWRIDSWSVGLYRWGFVVFALIVAVLIAAATRPGPLAWLLEARPLAAIGRRSYGLYLWHWPVVAFTRPGQDVPVHGVANLGLKVVLIAGISELCYRYVETPTRRYGVAGAWHRLRRSRAGRVPVRGLIIGGVGALAASTAAAAALATPNREVIPGLQGTPPIATAPASTPSASSTAGATASSGATPSSGAPVPTGATRAMNVAIYGDSVALGAAPALRKGFASVYDSAKIGEQAWDVLGQLKQQGPGLTQDVVLIHTGNNGIIDPGLLRSAIQAVPARARVIVVLPRVPRSWQQPNLSVLRNVAHQEPRVRLADWYALSDGHPEWFEDGVHLTPAGTRAYAALIERTAAAKG